MGSRSGIREGIILGIMREGNDVSVPAGYSEYPWLGSDSSGPGLA